MKIAYLDCFSGISGDMTLGALVDAGLKLKTLERELARLRLKGYTLSARKGTRGGLRGTKFTVRLDKGRKPPARHLEDILKTIDRSRLAMPVKRTASAIFNRLGKAEAKVHGIPLAKVHFHEAGAVDSIVDIVGTAIAIHELEIEQVHCSPIALGSGWVQCDHGTLPVPVPAVVELLKTIPSVGSDVPAELTTPTGAAIAVTLADRFGPLPAMEMTGVGYGLGFRDNAQRPNALRLFLGSTVAAAHADQVVEVESNIDDMTPEVIGYLFERFFIAGALDVYTTPIQMKKNRPALKLSVLAHPADLPAVEAVFFQETTTFGIRIRACERKKLARESGTVKTRWGQVCVVSGRLDGRVVKVTPEYEACKAVATRRRVPLRAVYDEVLAALAKNKVQ